MQSNDSASGRRIDTHCHMIPSEYADWLRAHPLFDDHLPAWSPQGTLDLFEQNGIETGILSVTMPGVWLGPGSSRDETHAWARRVNEYGATLVRESPDRFGYFATVTLPDVDQAVREAEYAIRELNADGITLLANTDGIYLGDPAFEPLFEAMDDLGAVLFIHPTKLPAPLLPGIMPGTVDFLADTTRAAVNLVTNGYTERFTRMKVILSHGGGYLPYAAMRIASMIGFSPERETEEQAMEWGLAQLRTFYFDLALTGGPALPALLSFADPTHLTYGSDYPFAPPTKSLHFTQHLDAADLSDAQRQAIDRSNAEALFPRLAG